ncbi:unnamed protein product, partial [Polarella glacialis]
MERLAGLGPLPCACRAQSSPLRPQSASSRLAGELKALRGSPPDWEGALAALSGAVRAGVELNVVVCGSVVGICGKARQWRQAAALLRSFQSLEVEPSTI